MIADELWFMATSAKADADAQKELRGRGRGNCVKLFRGIVLASAMLASGCAATPPRLADTSEAYHKAALDYCAPNGCVFVPLEVWVQIVQYLKDEGVLP